jgi:hypothetical protein
MANDVIQFDVDDNLDERLSAFQGKLARVILREALAAGGLVLKNAVIERAPERTDDVKGGNSLPPGALKMDIGGDVKLFPERNSGIVRVGPSDLTAYVAWWLEKGHDIKSHGKKKSRRVIGHVPPERFMVPAFDESMDAALAAFAAKLKEGLEEAEKNGSH